MMGLSALIGTPGTLAAGCGVADAPPGAFDMLGGAGVGVDASGGEFPIRSWPE